MSQLARIRHVQKDDPLFEKLLRVVVNGQLREYGIAWLWRHVRQLSEGATASSNDQGSKG